MKKNNKHVEVMLLDDDTYLFTYRSKYRIYNTDGAFTGIEWLYGLMEASLKPTLYDGIHDDDVEDMIIAIETSLHIFLKNMER